MWSQEKEQALCGFSRSWGAKEAMAAEARGEEKKRVLVLVSLPGASAVTEPYPVVS